MKSGITIRLIDMTHLRLLQEYRKEIAGGQPKWALELCLLHFLVVEQLHYLTDLRESGYKRVICELREDHMIKQIE